MRSLKQKNLRYADPTSHKSNKLSFETVASRRKPQTSGTKECRICLETSAQSPSKELINPCQCSGSIKYVHSECLKEWLLSCLKNKSNKESSKAKRDGIECQMCRKRIKFHCESRWTCNSCQEISEQMAQKRYLFIVLIILFLLSSSGAGFSVYSLVGGGAQLSQTNGQNLKFEVILALCGAFLMTMFLIVTIYTFVVDFFLKYRLTISRIGEGGNNRSQIYPLEHYQHSNIQIIDIQ